MYGDFLWCFFGMQHRESSAKAGVDGTTSYDMKDSRVVYGSE